MQAIATTTLGCVWGFSFSAQKQVKRQTYEPVIALSEVTQKKQLIDCYFLC
jgi:hypothetical protein